MTKKKPKPKPVMLADVTFTDAQGRECERYVARVRRSRFGNIGRGWRWHMPYDNLTKRFLEEPAGDIDQLPGSWNGGEIWSWLAHTSVDWYDKRTGAKGIARWERLLEQRRIKAVEKKLDGAA